MIVGTAGHIDHGKTTLVQALTGVDTDRLPEEKRRGISIELGYAFLDLPRPDDIPAGAGADTGADTGADAEDGTDTARIGFIDVPGHERLVRTMIAGATGIDHALLLVAADDGVMPQTREHLAVLSLLGLSTGTAVLTKTDRVDAARVEQVRREVRVLLDGSSLQAAPTFAVSAHTGDGLDELRRHLARIAWAHRRAGDDRLAFRLAIDRAFTLDGVGTVVTGTVHAGSVAVGDELLRLPGQSTAMRVRSLHAQNRPVQRARAGQRCALALAGVAREDLARGQWLVGATAASVSDRIDARLRLWPGEARALRSGTTVQLHLGAASVPATVAVLAGSGGQADASTASRDVIAPGEEALVQLVLRAPVGVWHGDRLVLRDAAQTRTIGGGSVLDPHAPARYRRTAQRLSELAARQAPDAPARLAALLAAAPHGVDLTRLVAAEGLRDPALLELPGGTLRAAAAGVHWALGESAAALAARTALDALRAFHDRHPDEPGPDSARLRRLALPRLPEPLWRALLERLLAEGCVQPMRAFLHLPEHGLQLSAVDQRIAQKAAPLLAQAGFEGAWVRDLARAGGEPEPLVRTTLARLAQRGELHQVVRDLYYDPPTVQALARLARQVAAGADDQAIRAAAFRDGTGLGRKRAIQVLEYFDRVGLLRRVGDVHRLRTDTVMFTES